MDAARAPFSRDARIVLALVVVAGALKIAEPLGGDQSLFLIGARALHGGARLYRDFWDLKQPGIYAFYFLATSFGWYGAVAIRGFDLAYQTVFAFVTVRALRGSRTFGAVAAFVPLCAVAYVYPAASSFEAVQVESLAGFPLFGTLACFVSGVRAANGRARVGWFVAGGVAAGIALAFKLIFLPIVVALWCAALAADARRVRERPRLVADAALATLAGLALPCAAIVASFATAGTLRVALETWFALPPRIVRGVPHETLRDLASGLRWFVHRFAGMLVLAAIGAVVALRRGADAFALGAIAWIAAGTAVILIQVTSWFQYQWLLLAAPVGMLATLGAAELGRAAGSARSRLRRAAALATLAAVAVVPATLLAHDVTLLVDNRFAVSPASRERYRDAASLVYAALRTDARYVSGPGALYVFGDPTLYVVAHRLQPVALNGSSVRLFLPDQWRELERELAAARPRYLYVSHGVAIRSASLERTIASYRLAHRGTLGDLFRCDRPAPRTARGALVCADAPTS